MTKLEQYRNAVILTYQTLHKLAGSDPLMQDHAGALREYLCFHECQGVSTVLAGKPGAFPASVPRTWALKQSTKALSDVADASIWWAALREHSLNVVRMAEEFERFLNPAPVEPPPPDPDAYQWVLKPPGASGTPGEIRNTETGVVKSSRNPIQDCLGAKYWSTSSRNRPSMVEAGDSILLMPGTYPHFRVTLDVWDDWVTIDGQGQAKIAPNPVGGSQSVYIEAGGMLRLRSLTILADDRMGIGTEQPYSRRWGDPSRHPGFGQLICRGVWIDGEGIVGELWGNLWHSMNVTWSGGGVRGIDKEHAFYDHNPVARTIIHNVVIENVGRTAYQRTGRKWEGGAGPIPPAKGGCYLTTLKIRNTGLNDGGSAITLAGRSEGEHLIEDCTVIQEGKGPQGKSAGCMVSHQGGGSGDEPTERIVIRGTEFSAVNPDRPVVSLAAFGSLSIENGVDGRPCVFDSEGSSKPALEIFGPADQVQIAPETMVRGELWFQGRWMADVSALVKELGG